jgi:uridylate kinase
MKKVVVSLGGSVIVPDEIDYKYLKKFKKLAKGFSRRNKLVVVCGGGSTARKYIDPLVRSRAGSKAYAKVGIAATRINARLVKNMFGLDYELPVDLRGVKRLLKKENLIVCGALGAKKGMTSDGNAVEIASSINADFFVNITNVDGLYDRDPRKNKRAKHIPEISYGNFLKMISKIKYKAGQHFVLDQASAKLIKKHKIKTYIVNEDLRNLKKTLKERRFRGTIIG